MLIKYLNKLLIALWFCEVEGFNRDELEADLRLIRLFDNIMCNFNG